MAGGAILVAVAVDGRMAGHLVRSDPLREGAGAMRDGLRRESIARILLATGGRADAAGRVTEGLGLEGLRAGLTPDQKVLLVLTERKHGPVMVVGDGVNVAPARAAADVGVAPEATPAGHLGTGAGDGIRPSMALTRSARLASRGVHAPSAVATAPGMATARMASGSRAKIGSRGGAIAQTPGATPTHGFHWRRAVSAGALADPVATEP
jgi:hypothetical protein